MSYCHSMTCYTQGIQATSPVQWRGLDGLVSVHWQASGQPGASGYYLSPDPRIVFFLNDVSSQIRISNRDGGIGQHCRPMARAIYVPAGMPMWTGFTTQHSFAHLDLHVHQDRLLRFLTPSLGRSEAMAAMRRPAEIQDVAALDSLAGLLVDEIGRPSRHGVYAENLVGGIFSYLLDIDTGRVETPSGLSAAQMDLLRARLVQSPDRKLSVAEMAGSLGLSESWFAHVFKRSTGTTPVQWQLGERIDLARRLLLESDLRLSEIATQLGFSDQAHLTRVFRQNCGLPPAAWRRIRRAQAQRADVAETAQGRSIAARQQF